MVVSGWRKLLKLSSSARRSFWNLLGPALLEPTSEAQEGRLRDFSRANGLSKADLDAALRSVGFLLERSSALDLPLGTFQADVAVLSEETTPEGLEVLFSRYDDIRAQLRSGVVQGSVADHGNVLVGLDWRIDNVIASDRGQVDTTIVLLTLRYLEGTKPGRLTLQLTTEALHEIKLFTDRVLSPTPTEAGPTPDSTPSPLAPPPP
jgi:hypothetical protein